MAKKRKKKSSPKKKKLKNSRAKEYVVELPRHPKYCFDRNIPIYDFIEDHNLDTNGWFGECLDNLIFCIEKGYFLTWEAVMCKEQGLPLTKKQIKTLDELISFADNEDELILYIDEFPRPKEPWYETLNKVVDKLVLDPFETYNIHDEIYHDGWPMLVDCLRAHANDLSLPEGATYPIDVIPDEISHRLWLQYCFDELSGLGQEDELTLENEDQKPWRIESFVDALRECKDSIEYFNLTLEELLKLVKLPSKDEKILIENMIETLNIKSLTDNLYDKL